MRKIKQVLLVLVVLAALVVWRVGFHDARPDPTRLDAVAIAAAETHMWRAYYGGEWEALGFELVGFLRNQMGLSLKTAGLAGKDLAYAAAAFAQATGDYERHALPPLERAYTRIAEALDAQWDPRAVAAAELDWWVARRTPGRNDPAIVGDAIASLYALLNGSANEDLAAAGRLRAEAAALRDRTAAGPDWDAIESMLHESYTHLVRGVNRPTETP